MLKSLADSLGDYCDDMDDRVVVGACGILSRAQQTAQLADAPVPEDQWKEKGINPPEPINKADLQPPVEMLRNPFNSRCLVSLIVDVNGLPQDIELVHSTDPAFGKFCMDWQPISI